MAKYRVHTYLTVRLVDEVAAQSYRQAASIAKGRTENVDRRLAGIAFDAEGRREFTVDRLRLDGDTANHRDFTEELTPAI